MPKGPSLQLHPAKPTDLPLICAWLRQNHLPDADVPQILDCLFLAQHQHVVVGLGGIEPHPPYGLLRSVMIAEPFRGNGYGQQLCHLLIEQAMAQHLQALVLLTETTPDFFASLGFQPIERQTAPAALQNTAEFSQLCPASAVCMRLDLPPKP